MLTTADVELSSFDGTHSPKSETNAFCHRVRNQNKNNTGKLGVRFIKNEAIVVGLLKITLDFLKIKHFESDQEKT